MNAGVCRNSEVGKSCMALLDIASKPELFLAAAYCLFGKPLARRVFKEWQNFSRGITTSENSKFCHFLS